MNTRITSLALGGVTLLAVGCSSPDFVSEYRTRLGDVQDRIEAADAAGATAGAEALMADTLGQLDQFTGQFFYAAVLAAEANFDAAAGEPFLADPYAVGGRSDAVSRQMAHAVAGTIYLQQARRVAQSPSLSLGSESVGTVLPESVLIGARSQEPVNGALEALSLRALALESRFGFMEAAGERVMELLPESTQGSLDTIALSEKLRSEYGLSELEEFWVVVALHKRLREFETSLATNLYRLAHWGYFLAEHDIDVSPISEEQQVANELLAWARSDDRAFQFVAPSNDAPADFDRDPREISDSDGVTIYARFEAKKL